MHPISLRAIVGGLLGTLAITFLMYFVAPLILGQPMDIAMLLGDFLGTSRNVGMTIHYINGTIIFPLIFVWLWRMLPGGPTRKGTVWGLILWVASQAIMMPLMGGGFFSANVGGFTAAVASLLGHLVYGAILGGVTGSFMTRTRTVEMRRAA